MKLKLDHIGYIVKDLKNSIRYFENLYNFKALNKIIYEKAHNVRLSFIDLGLNTMPALELIEPINKLSKVYNFLKNNGEGLHHLAYQVDNIENITKKFKEKGFIQISEIVPGAGHNKTKTIWLLGKKRELIELIQKQKGKSKSKRFTKS